MSKSVDFYFDLASPYAYMASTKIDEVCERAGAKVNWKPFLLGGVFKATGNEMPARIPAKAAYMQKDLRNWADYYKVEFNFPGHFPINSVKPMRACIAAGKEGKLREFARKMYDAYWVHGKKIDDPAVIEEVAADVGLDGKKLLEQIETDEVKDELKKLTGEAIERGAFGAPFMATDRHIFWGNDRLPLLEHVLRNG